MIRFNNRGDTIIEVVLAMGLLTSVLFIAWGITNRATLIQRSASERVQMVDQLKEQAELIKALWAQDPTYFQGPPAGSFSVVDAAVPNADPCSNSDTSTIQVPGGSEWYLRRASGGSGIQVEPSAKSVNNDGLMKIWVQKVTLTGRQDFYIRGCWVDRSGTSNKTDSTQAILRLNI